MTSIKTVSSNKAFTLTEILIVISIVGLIAGLGLPNFTKMIENARSNEARTNLSIIHTGQKIYSLNNGTFWNGGSNAVIATINSTLNTDISAVYYTDFDFTLPTPSTYTCTATRVGGSGSPAKWFRINETGTITEGGNY